MRLPHNSEVQTLIHQADGDVGGAEFVELYGNARVAAVKLRQDHREDPLGAVGSHSDADRALIDAVFRQVEGEVFLHV